MQETKAMKETKRDLEKMRLRPQNLPSIEKLVRVENGEVSARIFVDPRIYELERDRIFGRSWLFVAHESEIPKAGDFVTRKMGEDPVIVWKGQDGKVRVFLNVCRHRGRKVCGEDLGCAAQMRCPYHGWTYSNKGELNVVPFFEGYQGKLDKGELGLYEAPRVESYGGMVFAKWEKGKGSLGDYLGEMKWVMDLMFRRSEGVEVVGPPMRWEVDANWKLGAANFAGDGTHIFTTHGFRTALGLETIARGERISYLFPTKKGHSTAISSWPLGMEHKPYLALPENLLPEMERKLSKGQLELMKSLQLVVGNIFPNMSFLQSASHTSEETSTDGEAMSFLTVRLWQPRGAAKMEVWSWFFADRNAPERWKNLSRESYLRSFGIAGWFEQDDMENWAEITHALKSPIAQRMWLQYKLGMKVTPADKWPGLGVAYLQRPTFLDLNERSFYDRWQKMIKQKN